MTARFISADGEVFEKVQYTLPSNTHSMRRHPLCLHSFSHHTSRLLPCPSLFFLFFTFSMSSSLTSHCSFTSSSFSFLPFLLLFPSRPSRCARRATHCTTSSSPLTHPTVCTTDGVRTVSSAERRDCVTMNCNTMDCMDTSQS